MIPSASSAFGAGGAKSTPMAEITSGRIRIGKELNQFQEFLNEWFYLCALVGTTMISGVYMLLYQCLQLAAQSWWWYTMDEPDCDLDDDDDWIPPEYHDAAADAGSPASSIQPDDLSVTGRAMPHQVPFDDHEDDFDDPSVWEDLNFDASF